MSEWKKNEWNKTPIGKEICTKDTLNFLTENKRKENWIKVTLIVCVCYVTFFTSITFLPFFLSFFLPVFLSFWVFLLYYLLSSYPSCISFEPEYLRVHWKRPPLNVCMHMFLLLHIQNKHKRYFCVLKPRSVIYRKARDWWQIFVHNRPRHTILIKITNHDKFDDQKTKHEITCRVHHCDRTSKLKSL